MIKKNINVETERHFCKMMCESLIIYHDRQGINSKNLFTYKMSLGYETVKAIYEETKEELSKAKTIAITDNRGITHIATI